MTPTPHQLLLDVVRLARDAGRAILRVYASSFAVMPKADASPLTEADLAAERMILAGLKRLTPEIPVISEESEALPHSERARWDWVWLVDPLDGTREFVQRNGEFTVNIALVHGHRPVLGVVHAPVLESDWYACEGYGAHHAGPDGLARPIRVADRRAERARVLGSRSHRGASLDAFLEAVGPHELIGLGSSLKFCRLAEGAGDVYPRLGPTSEWDTAAGQCILEQAGGHVVDLEGHPLTYNARASLTNPDFIAYADSSVDWARLLRC